jgi:hypothetical protein
VVPLVPSEIVRTSKWKWVKMLEKHVRKILNLEITILIIKDQENVVVVPLL